MRVGRNAVNWFGANKLGYAKLSFFQKLAAYRLRNRVEEVEVANWKQKQWFDNHQ